MLGGSDPLTAPGVIGRILPMKKSGRGALRWAVAIRTASGTWYGYVLYFVPKTRRWSLTPSANLLDRLGKLSQADMFEKPVGTIPAGVKLNADAVLPFLPAQEQARAAREAIAMRAS